MGKKKIRRTLSALLLLTSVAVTQVPVSDVAAQTVSDFQVENKVLVKYTGTAEQAVSVPAQVKTVGESSFSGHNELVKVTIGNNVEKISNTAFADCNSLRTIVIGDSVKEIESGAFSNCPNLTSVTVGTGLRELGSGVFAGCDNLKNITIAGENTGLTYRSGVLYNQDETVIYQLLPGYEIENYNMPDSVSEIRGYAFWGNPYLKNVSFGNSLTDVPAYAFSNCFNLSQVTLSHLVRSIGAKAFEDCVNLQKVNLPVSVSRIHETAFDGCSKVEFDTEEGTYGAEYAAGRDVSQVAQTEQAEVADSSIIRPRAADDITADSPTHTEGNDVSGNSVNTENSEVSGSSAVVPDNSVNETSYSPSIGGSLIGQSRIVSGRAVVFIDNATTVYSGSTDNSLPEDGQIIDGINDAGSANTGEGEVNLEDLMSGSDDKGFGFPKYTILDDQIIADQAYYRESQLISYEIPQGITEIGDFSFARTGLIEINIPDGVERIGYAAFYHCDNLKKVSIPDTVTEIEPSAFDHTAWMKNWMNQVGQDYLIVGDGILLAYSGKNSVIVIPEGVKKIASGVFKDHIGITAVNLPESLEVIGEEAFAGCRNLKTVNGGGGVSEIRDRAFQDCILSTVTIAENVQKLGLRAFDLGAGGTDSVTFAGGQLPQITAEKTAMRLANTDYRDMVFGDMTEAYINDVGIELTDTVLDGALLGFGGTVCLTDGTVIRESLQEQETEAGEGVSVRISSRFLADDGIASAAIPGENGGYILKIIDSDNAADQITKAYKNLYGNQEPAGLLAFDISLYEQSGHAQVTRLGKQHAEIVIPKPEGIGTENLHVVCVDANGQLEEVPHQIVQVGDKEGIRFTAGHFSAYGIYQYGGTLTEADGRTVIGSLSGKRDASPDTGDFLHPKWFLAFGLLCTAVVLYFYRGGKKKACSGAF